MSMAAKTLRVVRTPAPSPRPLRVHYLIDSLGPGGAEHLLAEYLERISELGVVPSVTALQKRGDNPVAERIRATGLRVEELDIRRLRQRGALRAVKEAIIRAAPDIVHTQLEFANILGTLAAKRLGIPTVCTLHTLDAPARGSRDARRFKLMAWVLRRHSPLVIAVSESARRHHLDHARLKPAQTVTLFNGIDLDRFGTVHPDAGSSVRRELGLDNDSAVITTVAVLREPKGIQHMIDALASVIEAVPNVRYLVVGEGSHRSALEAHIEGAGLRDRVIIAGARNDVPEVLAASDLFVLPSLTEALPTVVVEAMAAGVPIVATRVGGIPKMVDHSDAALLVPPANPAALGAAAIRILTNPWQAAAMGGAARRLADERFDIVVQATRLVSRYRECAAAHARAWR